MDHPTDALAGRWRALLPALLTLVAWWPVGAQEQTPPDAVTVAVCTTCHGENGLPSDPAIPIIWGQEFYYLYVQLKDFKSGLRASPVMSVVVENLSRERMKALAQHFADRKWPGTGFRATDAEVAKGERATIAGQCVQCHLGGYEGDSRIPRLAGQQVGYLARTMADFKNKVRLNSAAKGSLLASYSDEDIAAMAHFLGGL